MKVTIKNGASVGQDMAQKRWPLAGYLDSGTVFELVDETRFADFIRAGSMPFKCVAPGFGGKPYGNGALNVKAEDLIAVEEGIDFVHCAICGREGGPSSGPVCPSCRVKASRPCNECRHIPDQAYCSECILETHSHWEPKTVQDVKVLASHDASKPIYGMFNTQPGDMIEVVVRDETLTCKVIKTIRKLSSGDTVTAELKE